MARSKSRMAPPRTPEEWSRLLATHTAAAEQAAHNEAEFREFAVPKYKEALAALFGIHPFAISAELRASRNTDLPHRVLDNLFGGVIVEWEFRMGEARRRHGAYQALEQLDIIARDYSSPSDTTPNPFTAVVSDGRVWGFLKSLPGEEFNFSDISEADAASHFHWVENSEAAVLLFLQLVGDHRKTPITAETLASSFGPSSDVGQQAVAVLMSAIAGREDGARGDTLYREWRRAMDVVHGNLDETENDALQEIAEIYDVSLDRSFGEVLFVLHTYFALVTRLVAVQFLATSTGDQSFLPSVWGSLDNPEMIDRLRRFDSGELPSGLVIRNLFEIDLFSWYLEHAEGDTDLTDGLRRILLSLDRLAFPSAVHGAAVAGDVLRDLYQSIVPSPMRRALGEFLTPQWLASACRDRLIELDAPLYTGRILDPTCGTGTFLTPILAKRLQTLRETNNHPGADEVQAILNDVAGIDLNPVAVIATRANFVMTLGDLAAIGNLTLSVWRSDSLIVPEDAPGNREMFHPLRELDYRLIKTSLPDPFPLPKSMARADRLAILRQRIEEAVAEWTHTASDSTDFFLAAIDSSFGMSSENPVCTDPEEWEKEKTILEYLFRQIQTLAEEKRDGIWAGIIENAFAPVFAGRFDVVIGNPPWLSWPKLPEAWRGDAVRLWQRYGLWELELEPGQTVSPHYNDIATLVFAVAVDRYAKNGGWIGFLTPDALVIADPGSRAFRKFRLKSRSLENREAIDIHFAPLHIDNWSEIHPFSPDAANRPVFIVAKKGQAFTGEVPGVVWRRTESGASLSKSWTTNRGMLTPDFGTYSPINPAIRTSALRFQSSTGPTLISGGNNHYRFGMGLNTRGANGILFVDLIDAKPREGQVQIVNRPRDGRDESVSSRTGWVESDLIYPLLRGRDVQAWVAEPSGYFFLPHDPGAVDRVLTPALWRNYRRALNWLRPFTTSLKSRSTIASARWDLENDDWCRVEGQFLHMTSEHVVIVREQQRRPSAAILQKRMDRSLGRTTAALVDHKLLVCAVSSREEALYLAAFINSTPIQDLIASFGSSTAISPTTLRRLPIRKFDATNSHAANLVNLADLIVSARNSVQKASELQSQIDQAVLALV